MYVFIAVGFGILFITDLDDNDLGRDSLNTMTYYWLWVVSLVFFAALYVYGVTDDISVFVHWVWAAYAWGTGIVYFCIAGYIWWWKYKKKGEKEGEKEGELTIKEMVVHGVLWIIVGFLFLLLEKNFWILGVVLGIDIVYTMWAHRNVLILKQTDSTMPKKDIIVSNGYTDLEIPKRYRKNTLRF
tara:strand:+ start:245 stop:799 length:555 start_codon:yes stop_codon:yes gene_type:complete